MTSKDRDILASKLQLKLNSMLRYRVVNKKVFHKSEGKMHKKMKMTLQTPKNLVHVKQHYSDSFCKKNIFLILIYIADMANKMSNFDLYQPNFFKIC